MAHVTLDRFKKAFTKKVSPDLLAVRQAKVKEAINELKACVDTLESIGAQVEPHRGALFSVVLSASNVVKSKDSREEKYERLDELKAEAREKAAAAKLALANAPEAQTGTGAFLSKAVGGKEKAGTLRTLAQQAVKTDPDALNKLSKIAGPKIIDDMMKDLGKKAQTQDEKDFVKAAIIARFDMTMLKGDLTTKALPKLYNVLAMVPESHARNNPQMARIKLEIGDGGGDYTGGQMNLNCNRANDDWHLRSFDPDEDVKKEWRTSESEDCEFTQTTLHEVGHSVDDKLGFMTGNLDDVTYGGWRKHTVAQVVDIVDKEFGFVKDWQNDYPVATLKYFLTMACQGQPSKGPWMTQKKKQAHMPTKTALQNDEGIKKAEVKRQELVQKGWTLADAKMETGSGNLKPKFTGEEFKIAKEIIVKMLHENVPMNTAIDDVLDELTNMTDAPNDKDWDEMMKHKATKWCEGARASNFYKKGAAEAKRLAIDSRVYVRDTKGWVSYDISARAKGVSQYQFNAPGEWFAELYAAYYTKKLPKTHPDYKWFEKDVHGVK